LHIAQILVVKYK